MSSKTAKRARAIVKPIAASFDARDRAIYERGRPLWRRIVGFLIPPLRRRWDAAFERAQAKFIHSTAKKACRAYRYGKGADR